MPDLPEAPPQAGEYRVSDDVVASIAGIAAAEVEGVAGLGVGLALGLGDVLGKRARARGVRVEVGSREAAVDVYLQVAFGVNIPTVAQRVQEAVKRAIEGMTALAVVEVNVHICGLDAGRPSAPAPAARTRSAAGGGPGAPAPAAGRVT